MEVAMKKPSAPDEKRRVDAIINEHLDQRRRAADRVFAILLILQWVGCNIAVLFVTPQSCIGNSSSINIHVWSSLTFGTMLTVYPVLLATYRSGRPLTRHVIAFAQIGWSTLLIHVTGGRIETHLHVFGALVFLAFYRDWKVLLTATVIVALDNFVRSIGLPQCVVGVVNGSAWCWLNLSGWALFENALLAAACFRGLPIIGLTANSMKGDRERFLDAGMDALTKNPIQPDELLRTISRILHPADCIHRHPRRHERQAGESMTGGAST